MTLLLLFSINVLAQVSNGALPKNFSGVNFAKFLSNSDVNQSGNVIRFDAKNYKWEGGVLQSAANSAVPGYRLELGSEKIEDSEIRTVTETSLREGGQGQEVSARTVTFDGAGLRSVTFCGGNKRESIARDIVRLKCVTATEQFCANVNQRARSKGIRNLAQISKKAEDCLQILNPLSRLAEGLSRSMSIPIDRRRSQVISQDQGRIELNLTSQTSRRFRNSVRTGSNSESAKLFEMSQGFDESIDGLKAMVEMVTLCNEFEDSNRASGSALPSSGGAVPVVLPNRSAQ